MSTKDTTATAHSIRPWEFLGDSPFINGFAIGKQGLPVAHVEGWFECKRSDRREAQANARLIAAAPELLKNLRSAVATYGDRLSLLKEEKEWREADEYEDMVGHYTCLKRNAEAAIAKAEGR